MASSTEQRIWSREQKLIGGIKGTCLGGRFRHTNKKWIESVDSCRKATYITGLRTPPPQPTLHLQRRPICTKEDRHNSLLHGMSRRDSHRICIVFHPLDQSHVDLNTNFCHILSIKSNKIWNFKGLSKENIFLLYTHIFLLKWNKISHIKAIIVLLSNRFIIHLLEKHV